MITCYRCGQPILTGRNSNDRETHYHGYNKQHSGETCLTAIIDRAEAAEAYAAELKVLNEVVADANDKLVVTCDELTVHVAELEAQLAELRVLTEMQCQDGNWNYDPYLHGLALGMSWPIRP